jgi:hypothetical protein
MIHSEKRTLKMMKKCFYPLMACAALLSFDSIGEVAKEPVKPAIAVKTQDGKFTEPGPRKYEIDRSKITYFVSPAGNDSNDGKSAAKAFLTMQKASDLVQPGETVLVMKGVYPNGFWTNKQGRPDAWISFIAEPGVEIRGSDVEKNWKTEDADKGIYSVERPTLVNPFGQKAETPLTLRTEQVFLNGKNLHQVSEKEMLKPKNVFFVDDNEKKILICLEGKADPKTQNCEVSRRCWAIAIGSHANRNSYTQTEIAKQCVASYIRVQGFTIRNIANFTRMAAVQIRGSAVNNIILEDCDIQYANHAAIAVAGQDYWSKEESKYMVSEVKDITVRHCIASNNGVTGIGDALVDNIVIEYNIMDNNNYKGASFTSEGGGFKGGFWGNNNVLRGNLIRNNENYGLWTDCGGEGYVFENNFVCGAIPGAVLVETTPANKIDYAEGGKKKCIVPTPEEARKNVRKGTIIRNNVFMNSRTPGGIAVSIANSSDSQVCNNIIFNNAGPAVEIKAHDRRTDATGARRNMVSGNICDENFCFVSLVKDEDDKFKATFDNVITGNLFLRAKNEKPFQLTGLPVTKEEFEAYSPKFKNVFDSGKIFRNPEAGDFTITNPELAKKINFDSSAMRLDWSAYFIKLKEKSIGSNNRANLDFEPLDLSSYFNRALKDDAPSDGKGGWSDQGANDMSLLPPGRQVFDGIPWIVGDPAAKSGAIMLATEKIKTEKPYPDTAVIGCAGKKYDEIFFLYTGAYCWGGKTADAKVRTNAQIAKFAVSYEDGTKAEIPLIYEKHIMDWWADPTWQQLSQLNENNCFIAWQGPNRSVSKVALYYLKWVNPNPEKPLKSIELSNKTADNDTVFFLLGVTGASRKVKDKAVPDRAFHIAFEKNMDAEGSAGNEIESSATRDASIRNLKFIPGVKGDAYASGFNMITYPVPNDFSNVSGTVSLWLKADDWKTEKRINEMKKTPYRHGMVPLSSVGTDKPWSLYFKISDDYEKIVLVPLVGGNFLSIVDIGALISPDKWFHLALTWCPDPKRPEQTEIKIYYDGKEIACQSFSGKPAPWSGLIYIGCPKNGGQAWFGGIDEVEVYKKVLTPDEINSKVDTRINDAPKDK